MLTFSWDAVQASTLPGEGDPGATVVAAAAPAGPAGCGDFWLPHAVTASAQVTAVRTPTVAARLPATGASNRRRITDRACGSWITLNLMASPSHYPAYSVRCRPGRATWSGASVRLAATHG